FFSSRHNHVPPQPFGPPSLPLPPRCRGPPSLRQYHRRPDPPRSAQPRTLAMVDHFGSQATLHAGNLDYTVFRLAAVEKAYPQAATLPYALKVVLENLLRTENGLTVRPEDVEALARWDPKAEPCREIAFTPARVLLQDFTGVPAVVDLAAMRDAMLRMGGDPRKINPLLP